MAVGNTSSSLARDLGTRLTLPTRRRCARLRNRTHKSQRPAGLCCSIPAQESRIVFPIPIGTGIAVMANSRMPNDSGCSRIISVNAEYPYRKSVPSRNVTDERGGAFIECCRVRIGPVANVGVLYAYCVSIVTYDVKGSVGLAHHLRDGAVTIHVIMCARWIVRRRGAPRVSNYSTERYRVPTVTRCSCMDYDTPYRTRCRERGTNAAASLPGNTTAIYVCRDERSGDS